MTFRYRYEHVEWGSCVKEEEERLGQGWKKREEARDEGCF
jgi:hypothetical protein